MQIVERYLQSVKSCLPAEQADDIVKELSENISAQVEDQESELGRALTETEVEAVLKQHGHPLVVASRYRQEQGRLAFGRQIIGPALFPFYLRVLKFNLGLTSVILLVIFSALFAGGQPVGAFAQIFAFQMVIQFAIVTGIFWLVDQHLTKFPDRWDPRKPYGTGHPAMTMVEGSPGISRARSASQLIGLLVGLAWLRAVQHSQFLIFGPAAAFLQLSPGWNRLYLPIHAVILLGITDAGISLLRPDWVRFHWAMRILGRVSELLVAYFLITRGNPLVMASAGGGSEAAHVAHMVSQCIYYCVWFAVIVGVVRLARDVQRIVNGKR